MRLSEAVATSITVGKATFVFLLQKDAAHKDLYFPLLVGVNKLLPEYHFHRTMAEKAAWLRKLKGKTITPSIVVAISTGVGQYLKYLCSIKVLRSCIVS